MKHLLITVGLGASGGAESLAWAIAYSVKTHYPDVVHFVVTKKSDSTTLPLVEQMLEEQEVILEKRKIYLTNGEERRFQDIFFRIQDYIKKLRTEDAKAKITVDFTAGTKPMSAGMVLGGCVAGVDGFSYIMNEGEGDKPLRGGETVLSFGEAFAYQVEEMKKLFAFCFDHYDLSSAAEVLTKMEKIINTSYVQIFVENWRNIVNFYFQWDLFNHPGEDFKGIPGIPERNKAFLGKLTNPRFPQRDIYFLADLLNNAQRRIAEKKFDDAVARFYRAVELIAQIKLRAKGVETSNVNTENLPQELRDKYESLHNDKGKIQLPLYKGYELLSDFGEELGKNFFDDHELRHLLEKRNNSILAHGFKPISEEDCLNLKNKILSMAALLHKNIGQVMEEGKFPDYQEVDNKLQ